MLQKALAKGLPRVLRLDSSKPIDRHASKVHSFSTEGATAPLRRAERDERPVAPLGVALLCARNMCVIGYSSNCNGQCI